ncbi:unnamed protein product, partial [Gadus morhua 'NCC']
MTRGEFEELTEVPLPREIFHHCNIACIRLRQQCQKSIRSNEARQGATLPSSPRGWELTAAAHRRLRCQTPLFELLLGLSHGEQIDITGRCRVARPRLLCVAPSVERTVLGLSPASAALDGWVEEFSVFFAGAPHANISKMWLPIPSVGSEEKKKGREEQEKEEEEEEEVEEE